MRLLLAKNEAAQQPSFNAQIARTYPERYAQEALGHASAAIHRAYAKSVRVELPPLEEYEKSKVLALPKAA